MVRRLLILTGQFQIVNYRSIS